MRSLILIAVTISILGSQSTSGHDSEKDKSPSDSREVIESPKVTKWFLEIVSESSDRPLTDTAVTSPLSHRRLQGYLFVPETDQLSGQLYPATGTEPANSHEVAFYLGYRLLDLAPEPIPELSSPAVFEHRSIVAVKKTETTFDGELLPREKMREQRAKAAAERPRVSISIEQKDDVIRLKMMDQKFTLKPGKVQVLQETAGGTKAAPAFHRLTAIAHKNVEVASFDTLHQWNRSQLLLIEGPYAEALAATELVLLADPTDKTALSQWQLINSLIEAGKTASQLDVRLKFAVGLDADPYLKRWKDKPTGILYLSAVDAPPGEALTGRMIDADVVKLPTPSGRYRVTMLLPGFRPFQQEIEINGRTKLEIPIAKSIP